MDVVLNEKYIYKKEVDMTILIVDDSPIMRQVLKEIIVSNCDVGPEEVSEASNGLEAIAMYQKKKPKLVFLDIIMPDLEGTEVAKMLKRIDPSARIVMCSYSADEDDMEKCREAGAKAYIIKPPQASLIVESVAKALSDD